LIAIDYVLLLVLGLSAGVGLIRGIVREAFSLGSWAVGIWAAWKFGLSAAVHVPDFTGSALVQLWIARAVILIGVLVLGGLLSWGLSYVTDKSGLSGTNRLAGMVFGFGRGVLLSGLLVMILQLGGYDHESWWQESKLIRYAAPVAGSLRDATQRGVEILQERGAGDLT